MKKFLLIFFLAAIPVFGQSTAVTATITDTSGQTWNLGSYSFSFYPAPTNPQGPYFWTGGAFNPSQPISGAISSSGTFAVSVPDNRTITPSGSQWTATVCPAASTSQCYSKTFTVTGATMDISSLLIPPPPQVKAVVEAQVSAYRDAEIVNPNLGTTYFNLMDNTIHACTVALPCTWVSIGGSGAGNPAAPSAALQLANSSVTGFSTANLSGTYLSLDSASSPTTLTNPFKLNQEGTQVNWGPNPWVDTQSYGMQAAGPAGYFQTTGSCTSGSPNVTLASASFFTNGGGIVIYKCGPSISLSTPGAPTVSAAVQSGPDINFDAVTGPTGGTTSYAYRIVARDRNGGLTAAGPTTTLTTGPATLGALTTNTSTLSRSGNVVTVTTSSANGAAANGIAYVTNSTDATFSGFVVVSGVNSPTQFTYQQGMSTLYGASTSATGGTVTTYQVNKVVWTPVTGAYQYYIYRNGTLAGATRPGESQWVDFGAAAPTLPDFVPSTPVGTPTNDYLATTILSGAGTINLVLANSATNTANNSTAKLDDAPNFINAWNACSFGTSQKCTIHFTHPGAGNQYFINSHVDLTQYGASIAVIQTAPITFNETMEITGPVSWSGELSGTGAVTPQFASNPGMYIGVGSAYPGMALSGASSFKYLSFVGTANGLLTTLNTNTSGPPFRFELKNSTMEIAQTDVVGEAMVMYGQSEAEFNDDTILVGGAPSPPSYGYSIVPAVLNRNDIANLYNPGHFVSHNSFYTNRGIGISSNPTFNESTVYEIIDTYSQAMRAPLIEFGSIGGAGSIFTIDNYLNDTSVTPWLANWNSAGATVILRDIYNNGVESSGQPPGVLSGFPVSAVLENNNATANSIGQNYQLSTLSGAAFCVNCFSSAYNFAVNGSSGFLSYLDVQGITTPANPPTGFQRWYASTSTSQFACLTSTGGNCAPSGGGGSTFQVNGTPLSSSSVINFTNSAPFNGVTFTETNPSAGIIQLGATGTFTNAALANPFTTVNGQTCTLGSTCNLPFQSNGVNNSSLGGLNLINSSSNSVGLAVTFSNPGTNQEQAEITGGTYSGTAAALGVTPTDCTGGQFATGIAANGNAICATPSGSGNFLVSGGAQYDIATFSGATSGIGIVPGTTGYSLVSNGASAYATFQQVSLTAGVTGLLPNANLANPSTTVNLSTCTLGSSCTVNPIIAVTNAGSTGTTLNTLTKVTGAPSTAVISAITDTSGMVGVTVSGAGTTGTATIQTTGQVSCVFSNSTTAGDYVQISPTVAGNCADTGSSTPPGGYSVGRVLSTNGSAGTYQIDLALGTGSSGGSSSFTGMTTNGVAYATSTTGGTSSTAPSINGQYSFGVNVTTGASTPPGFSLVGLTGPTTLTGSVNSYTTTYADNSSVIPHYFASTVSVTLNLSTPTTVLNPSPVYSYSNHSTHIDTIAPAGGFTIQSGNSAAASSINVSPGVECRIMIDPLNPGSNWLSDCRPNGGFSTIGFASVTGGTGAGAYLISNSLAPTGAGTVEATQMWNVIGSSTPPSIGQCWVASSATAAGWSGCTGSLAFPLTVSGTVNSGGIPGFTSTTTMASSALLALGQVMLGGGAGATPTTDANLDDGQTTANQLTYAGTAGLKVSQGPVIAGLNGGVSQPFILQEGTVPASSGGQDRCYGDSSLHAILCSLNNGSYLQEAFSSTTTSTIGNVLTFNGTGGKTFQDSFIPGANLVLAATPAASAKQICTATANSSKTCSYIDFPEVFQFPTANVNGSNAGNGWSINTICGTLPAIYARTGTNLATGYLQFSASESACTQFELPADWDTATNPYIRVNYTQNASTASQSIIYTIQVGCSATTDDAAYATAQTFSTTTTGATANTPYTQTLQLNSTSMTACAGGSMMNLKVSTAAGSSAVTNLQMVSLTVPRLITVQAN